MFLQRRRITVLSKGFRRLKFRSDCEAGQSPQRVHILCIAEAMVLVEKDPWRM